MTKYEQPVASYQNYIRVLGAAKYVHTCINQSAN